MILGVRGIAKFENPCISSSRFGYLASHTADLKSHQRDTFHRLRHIAFADEGYVSPFRDTDNPCT